MGGSKGQDTRMQEKSCPYGLLKRTGYEDAVKKLPVWEVQKDRLRGCRRKDVRMGGSKGQDTRMQEKSCPYGLLKRTGYEDAVKKLSVWLVQKDRIRGCRRKAVRMGGSKGQDTRMQLKSCPYGGSKGQVTSLQLKSCPIPSSTSESYSATP
ncbi:hypothetical protein [Mesobacillus subterraneus]|uniref:Uncharacterized protein n=1 Tax=Mesobacillus subterraneus TaxID=285983 RepID=A0A427TQY6_9BACI|nr:hypothetical protein [Mesobacillus subterraneus]RSD26800.1 hypothetical protein EJA10_13160 [Mesobacillus subterraneus]